MKQAVIDATDRSTIVFARKTGISRCLKNRFTMTYLEMENLGIPLEKLNCFGRSSPELGEWRRVPGGLVAGNVEAGSLPMGAAAGMIKDVRPAGEIIRQILSQYDTIVSTLS